MVDVGGSLIGAPVQRTKERVMRKAVINDIHLNYLYVVIYRQSKPNIHDWRKPTSCLY